MKKMIFLGWLIVFLPAMVLAQEKVEAPVWNVGDKWVFTGGGTIEVLKVDQNGYVVKFSDTICIFEGQGFNTIIFDKSTLQRTHTLKGDKISKYAIGLKNVFNFPLNLGKQWKHAYSAKPIITKGYITGGGIPILDYYENIKIFRWEEVEVKAGRFRTLKIELVHGHKDYQMGLFPRPGFEFKNYYWYSPGVKYFVKCQYDPESLKQFSGELFNWELISFQLKK